MIINYKATDTGVIKLYNYCRRCGKPLKTLDARMLGYGKTCLEKNRQKQMKRKLL